MKLLAGLVFIVILAEVAVGVKNRYDNYKVYEVNVDSEEQLKVLDKLERLAFSSYDFWKRPSSVGRPVNIMVPPHKAAEFDEIMTSLNFRSSLKISNVQELIDNEQPKNPREGFNWGQYHTMDEINAWLDAIADQYNDVVTPITLGYSYEVQPIKCVLISHRSGNPAVFIESHIHAREWIAGATATYLINELLTSQDPEIRRLAEHYDWYICPVTNPDGYRYSHDVDRMWRKTRSRRDIVCIGVDPNRNFGHMWQDGSAPGASNNPCSEAYAGPYAFSELETYHLSNFVSQHSDHIKVYLSLHSFTQLLLYPFSYRSEPNHIAEDMHRIGDAAVYRLRQPFGTEYTVMNGFGLYIGTGISTDWSFGGAGINLTYLYEFRDLGQYGFLLPPEQIEPNSIEFVQSLIGLTEEAEHLGYLP